MGPIFSIPDRANGAAPLSRPMLFAAVFSVILHILMLGAAATQLVTQGRATLIPLKVTLLQRAVPLPVGEGPAPAGKAAEPEKQPAPAPPRPPPKPQPKPKAPKPRAVAPAKPKAKKPLPPKEVVTPARVEAPPQPAPPPLPAPQEGISAETGAGETVTEMRDGKDGGGSAATVTQGAGAISGGGGFSARPDYGINPKPPYPYIARRTGMQGVVLLLVQVRADGTVAEVRVARSSGSALLDASALQTVRDSWRFIPARRDGIPVESWVEVPIRFVLEDS